MAKTDYVKMRVNGQSAKVRIFSTSQKFNDAFVPELKLLTIGEFQAQNITFPKVEEAEMRVEIQFPLRADMGLIFEHYWGLVLEKLHEIYKPEDFPYIHAEYEG